MEDETPFLFRSPFRPDQRAEAVERSAASIESDLQFIQTRGYDEFIRRRAAHHEADYYDDEEDENTTTNDKNLGSPFEGSLRDYQIYMLEKAREENVIAHLGTGMGKTLISIFLIREFLSRRNSNDGNDNHILFLVPSIALAVQHTDTLKANLPCVVATACHTSSHSPKAREEIADADVIVATHGTSLDLLRHYPDVLSMKKVELLVMDECHYAATGKHNYATILKDYFHPLLRKDRPRVLGLTASPLINLRIHNSKSRLQMLLSNLEKMMDARLYGFPSGILPGGNREKKEAEESVVTYDSRSDSFDTNFPPAQWNSLHKSRKKEIAQLQDLCHEVGLRVTAVYTSTLVEEISRNEFDRETQAQFENLKSYLRGLTECLNRAIYQGRGGIHDGHTNKMNELEELLADAVKPGGDLTGQQAPVGIVFVERRITAIALCNYFNQKQKQCGGRGGFPQFDTADAQSPTACLGCQDRNMCNDSNGQETVLSHHENTIRCDVVVRRATQVFKYLGRKEPANHRQLEQLEDEWVHQTKQIRTIINKLRCRETNVLMATSVVEEGVDVEACQFIIAFNGLTTIKSYVQMKGRARQKNARFFVFVDHALDKSQPLTLSDAQTMEDVIHSFIAENQNEVQSENLPTISSVLGHSFFSDEEGAMHYGKYTTSMSSVDLSSSKSLLNRYALSVPLEPNSRTSKEATTLHMPIYAENKLILPSHLPPTIREVALPIVFRGEAKKKKQSLLALAACVRLHKLGLLNDRLLPLSMSDMKEWLLKKAFIELPSFTRQWPTAFEPSLVYVYRIAQCGVRFEEVEMEVCEQEPGEMQLALISISSLPENLPAYSFAHKELGLIECKLSYCGKANLSGSEWEELTSFHSILFNSRWRQRRKKSKRFCFDVDILEDQNRTFAPYVIGCLDSFGGIDWMCIRSTITEFSRSLTAREKAAQDDSGVEPRIWIPSYNQGVSYIVYGPSGKKCIDPFPGEGYSSFQDYYAKKYGIEISPNGELYQAKRMWEFPQTLGPTEVESFLDEDIRYIPIVDLPQELFAESPLADPVIMLHSIVLPQLLYQLERYLTVISFVEHCVRNFPMFGECLSKLSVESVMESLTAKSCCLSVTYDRLEWLGDAVLKLLHTDSLLRCEYTSYLHEGYLTMIRSVMGSNDRLKDIAKAAGFERFILLKPLNRAEWYPFGLRYCQVDEHCCEQALGTGHYVQQAEPSDKVYADVIEALIGLIFLGFGYEHCEEVVCELGVSFRSGNVDNICRRWSVMSPDQNLISFACDFVGVTNFLNPHLLVEATTHQSCLHKPVPSYQRLEWVGDAVLCLAARDWLFRREENLAVPKLVVLETTLVCNESLAYLGYDKGLHRFIDHRNAALLGRFQSYQLDLEIGRGLWSTDPPKVIPDVMEALIGAVHVDSGLHTGQKAALHVIAPLLESISGLLDGELKNLTGLLHPKQNLFEMTGGIVSARAYKEDRFNQMCFPSPLLWEFGNRSSDGLGYVGVVKCKQILLATAVEPTKTAAINVACELAVQILREKSCIISKLHEMLSTLAE